MVPRILAVVLLAGLALFVFMKQRSASTPGEVPQDVDRQPGYIKADVEGMPPEVPPEFDVQVEVRPEGTQKLIYFTVTERHGWYADQVYIDYWYRERDQNGEWKKMSEPSTFLARKYLDFKSTMVDNTVLYRPDFQGVEDFGTTENWEATVSNYGKVLAPKGG